MSKTNRSNKPSRRHILGASLVLTTQAVAAFAAYRGASALADDILSTSNETKFGRRGTNNVREMIAAGADPERVDIIDKGFDGVREQIITENDAISAIAGCAASATAMLGVEVGRRQLVSLFSPRAQKDQRHKQIVHEARIRAARMRDQPERMIGTPKGRPLQSEQSNTFYTDASNGQIERLFLQMLGNEGVGNPLESRSVRSAIRNVDTNNPEKLNALGEAVHEHSPRVSIAQAITLWKRANDHIHQKNARSPTPDYYQAYLRNTLED